MSQARAIYFVLAQEGGLVDDPNDPGGLSNYGIALNRHPELTADQIRNMTQAQAAQIYATTYWQAIQGDSLPGWLQTPMLDTAVNMGPGAAVQILQRTLKIPEDGKLGPQTLNAANLASDRLLPSFAAQRVMVYAKLPGWEQYGLGWVTRTFAACAEALQ